MIPGHLKRFDERDTMFSRKTLVPGTPRYEQYYRMHPEKKEADDRFRRLPGLLQAGSRYYDEELFNRARELFDQVEQFHPRVEGEPAAEKVDVEPAVVTGELKAMVTAWGAHSAGVCRLRDYHVYSAGGRADRYGIPFEPEHRFAIALTVEMDYDMMCTAPAAPTVVESARQYLRSGRMAVRLAEHIRQMGYPARAHIDANYKLVCPLVARDAGLGEIGRMGLLMTPVLGPRVRIAVVTTDLPLVVDPVRPDPAMIDFCRHCRKCALVCPGRSIPFGPEKVIDGVWRWQIDSESCYTFWCLAGTDCGRCMIVCPYAHRDNRFHRMVRRAIRKSKLVRRLAIPLDDLVYGKKPQPRNYPGTERKPNRI